MMRIVLLLPFTFVFASGMAQQVVFSEDFEGSGPAFTMNTTDMGSTATGANTWLVNDAYSGGSGTMECIGFPFSFNIPTTPAQPAGISNANGNYLHITSNTAINNGILNCNFAAADGICTFAANHFTRMSADVSTIGADEVSLSFWWLCAGGPNNYGELYYSTDGGTAWTIATTPVAAYSNQSTWAQQTVTLPAFAGQATLRFGFRFVNNQATAPSDPAFGIDDVSISVTSVETEVVTGAMASTTQCQGSSFDLPYTASGTWNAGNVFTAELSDINGSFAAATAIGSVASETSGTISCTIPVATVNGTGYLVRVVGSDPAVVAGNTTAELTIEESPYAGEDLHISFCESDTAQVLLDFLPGASTCGEWTDPDGVAMSGILDPSTAESGDYTFTANCPASCPEDQATLVVGIVPAPDAGEDAVATICLNSGGVSLFALLGGTPDAGGTWTEGGVFIPGTDSSGCYVYIVAGVSPCPADSAQVCVTVENCAGIEDNGLMWSAVRWIGQQGNIQLVHLGGTKPDQVRLYDASGRAMQVTAQMEGGTLRLNMADAASGVYLLHLYQNRHTGTVRLVHRR